MEGKCGKIEKKKEEKWGKYLGIERLNPEGISGILGGKMGEMREKYGGEMWGWRD